MADTTDDRGFGSHALTGAICGFVIAAVTHTIGFSRSQAPYADEVRALFDADPILGYVLYVLGGAVVGVVFGWIGWPYRN